MQLKEMKEHYEKNSKIKIKLYSLEYMIEQLNNVVEVYAIDDATRKKQYKSFDDAINNFTVYNESLASQINKISLIKE